MSESNSKSWMYLGIETLIEMLILAFFVYVGWGTFILVIALGFYIFNNIGLLFILLVGGLDDPRFIDACIRIKKNLLTVPQCVTTIAVLGLSYFALFGFTASIAYLVLHSSIILLTRKIVDTFTKN